MLYCNRILKFSYFVCRGMRVPYLSVGWNRQFLMMQEFGFVYDATIVAPFADPPYWPYTLDYKMPHKCMGTYSASLVLFWLCIHFTKILHCHCTQTEAVSITSEE